MLIKSGMLTKYLSYFLCTGNVGFLLNILLNWNFYSSGGMGLKCGVVDTFNEGDSDQEREKKKK